MALRNIRVDGDPILRKRSREVKEVNENIKTLIEDMKETMYDAKGIGLAAPQVGVLRRVIVVDVGDEDEFIALVNPEIIDQNGEEIGVEGCLSIPSFNGTVKRPESITVKFINEDGNDEVLLASGLKARCICHEIDHLDGVLFKDKFIQEAYYDEEGNLHLVGEDE